LAPVTGSIEASGDADRCSVTEAEARRAARSWWDAHADEYQAEHGAALGGSSLVWGPEGLTEAAAGLLGPLQGARVLEVGCGAGQGSRWVSAVGGVALGVDLSLGQLRHASGTAEGRWVCADATALPLGPDSVDVAFSAYGALQFVADPEVVHREVARVLRPGGRWVFSVTHPVRWAFPDDPGPDGLTAVRSYFDRTPYVEQDDGAVTYLEAHRTLGDQFQMLRRQGFVIDDLVEPEWPDDLDRTWGGWSALRGRLIPGTVVFVTHLIEPSTTMGARGPSARDQAPGTRP
jgi:SAM-dependent methyltransferase